MLLNYTNEITILYKLIYWSMSLHIFRNYKRSGGNDEQKKLNKLRMKRVYVFYKFYYSSRLFIPLGSNVPAKIKRKCW